MENLITKAAIWWMRRSGYYSIKLPFDGLVVGNGYGVWSNERREWVIKSNGPLVQFKELHGLNGTLLHDDTPITGIDSAFGVSGEYGADGLPNPA